MIPEADRGMGPLALELGETEMEVEIGDELDESFFEGKCSEIAKRLVGKLLVREGGEKVGGIVSETEAYLGNEDPACHFYVGETKRTQPFLSGRGTVYVFKIFRHNNLNIITEYKNEPECILIRAIHPTHGIDEMLSRREVDSPQELTTGPGKLTQAIGVSKATHNNVQLGDSDLHVYDTSLDCPDITTTRRVGISKAEDWPLRYTLADSPYVSRHWSAQPDPDHEPIERCYQAFEQAAATPRRSPKRPSPRRPTPS